MKEVIKLQLVSNTKSWLALITFCTLILLLPVITFEPFAINIILLIFFLKRDHYFGFLLEQNYYKQLLTTPLRSKEIYTLSFMSGLYMTLLYFVTSLILGIWQAFSMDEPAIFTGQSPIIETIALSIWATSILLVALGYYLHYTFRDGLRDHLAEEFIIIFGVFILFGVPSLLLFVYFSSSWLWACVIALIVISFFIYYRMYVKTLKLVPHLVVNVDVKKDFIQHEKGLSRK